ncbi:hypothetical protein LUZ60_015245 [Juncus effusus]|nr:hypothetical protein LUZ60_015245 [Juncus effusus]
MAFFLATSCNLHPDETFTGFCPSCLRERLAGLDAASSLSSAPRRSTSALKSIFSILPSSSSANAGAGLDASSSAAAPPQPVASSSSELRRCKSFSARSASSAFVRSNSQIVREERVREERMDPNGDMRPMKIHIDLESQSINRNQKGSSSSKDPSSASSGNFWIKKWNSWRNKQKQKKQDQHTSKAAKAAMPPPQKLPKPSRHTRPRRHCDTQSELGGGGRRSCDTDPRFSVDAGRISFDCPPRFSFDEPPRASWDGYSAAGRPVYSRMHPTLSTVEDAPDPPAIGRSDGHIPVAGADQEYQESTFPGSQSQTRDYYLDSSSRRRRSFERSISGRKPPPQTDLETLDHRSNSKVSPAGSSEFHHFHHLSARDELSESFDSSHRDPCEKKPKKWSLWGLIHKKRKDQNANVVDRSFSEAWPELRSNNNINNQQFLRSNSTVSARSSFSGRRKSLDINGGISNRSARFENNNVNINNGDNNGMLRFYLNPMVGNQSGRRSSGIRPVNYSSNSNSQSYSSKRIY